MEDQLINDMMPNNSEIMQPYEPETPEEVVESVNEERSIMSTAAPIVEDLLEFFDDQIQNANTVETVVAISKSRGISIDEAMHASDIVRTMLEDSKSALEARFAAFQQSQEDRDE